MATSTVTDWDEIEADPEFSSLPQESRVRLFDDWEKKFNRTLLEDADLDKVKPEGLNRLAATNAVRRHKLAGEDVSDPNAAVKSWSTQKQAEVKLGQQMLKDYADVEDKKFRLDDARSMPGVDDLGRAAPWWEEGVEKATKNLEAAEAKLVPEVRAQAQAASEALKGKRKIATLNGNIYTDPALVLDKDEFRQQVLDSDAPPEAKALKLASFQNEKKRYLDEAINTLTKGDPQIPLAESFPRFLEAKGFDLDREMAKQSEGKLDYSPIQKQRELAQEYLTKMQDRDWFRKIGSAISTGVATGMLDIGTQAVGTAAMLTGDEEKSKVAAELSRASGDIGAAQGLEGDMQATGGTFAGGVSRLGTNMAPMLLPGGAVGGIARLAGAGAGAATAAAVGASALTAGAQTAGSQFGEVYDYLRQQGRTHEQAFDVSRNAAVLSGAVTTALTALGGATGVEALLRQGGKELVKNRLVAALKAVPGGAAAEIAEELPDEYVSQLVSAFAKDPNASPSQVTDEFAANAPDLILQIAALGGAGSGVSRFKETTSDPAKAAQEAEFPAAGAPPPLKPEDYENRAAGGQPVFDGDGNVIGVAPPGATPEETAAYRDDIRKAAEEAVKQQEAPVEEVVAPIEGVDPAITDEMNERLAASAALAPQTVEALKAAPTPEVQAEIAEPIETEGAGAAEAESEDSLRKQWQRLEDRALAATEAGATDRVPAIRDEQGRISRRMSKAAQEVDTEPDISTEWEYTALDNQGKELRGTMRAATQADAIAGLRQQGLYPTHVNATAALPTQDAVSASRNTDLFPDKTDFMGKLSQEAILSNYQERDGFGVAEYVNPDTGTTDVYLAAFGDNDFIAYIRVYDENGKPTNRFTSKLERRSKAPGVTKKMLSDLQSRLPAGHEYTEDVSVSTDGLKFIAGQLRQGYEVALDESGKPLTQDVAVSGESIVNDLPIAVDPNGKFENIRITNRAEFDKVRPVLGKMLESFGVGLGAQNVRWENGTAFIDIPVLRRKPAATATPTAETLGVTPPPAPTLEAPEGAARNADMLRQAAARAAGTEQGPRIGFLQSPPAVTTETETPINAANVDGGSQGVQTESAEGSVPTVTEDTVSISDIPSTAEIQPEVRENPTPEEKAELEELDSLMERRGQAQNKVKGVAFSKKDEARFQELGAKLRRFLFETVDAANDAVVGEDINGQPIRQSKNGTLYAVENGRIRTAPAFKPDPEYSRQQDELLAKQKASPAVEEAPASEEWSPTPGQPATANINGQKVVGTVGPSTGSGFVGFQYEWNGKTQKATVRPDRLSRPVASLVEPPSYQYTQEQNTRKAGKHFPTAPGLYANHDFRKSFASMAEDTSLSRIYRQIAKVMSKMDAFANIDLHIVADGDIGYAGEYSHSNGKSSIAVNLRQVARGKVDALGTILHEALHHITLAKVRNPQGAFETEVVAKLDTIRKRVKEYAKQQGLGKRLGYELNTLEEFISALTSPDFQNFLASIPDSFSTGVSVGKFRSALSEVFRLIAELIKGEPVARGSAMEQYFTTVLALFETPHRTLDIGKLEKLSAVQSEAAQASPTFSDSEAGNLTPPDEDGWREEFVAEKNGYKIAVNDVAGATSASVWRDGKKVGYLTSLTLMANARKSPDGWLGIHKAWIDKDHRGKGIGTEMYRALAEHLGEDENGTPYEGIYSQPLANAGNDTSRHNDAEIPTIYKKLGGWFDADGEGFLPRISSESSSASLAEQPERRGYRTPADMLAEAAQKAKGEAVGTKPQGLASMFKPQAKRPATGERKLLDMPVRNTLANAYREAVRGSGTQFAPLSSVYAQARLLQPGLTPEAFLAQVQEGYDNGTLLLEGAGSQQEAAQAGLSLPGTPVGTAVRMMPAPETPKSLVDEEADAEYMAAVEAGDMETAQRMVNEAAKAAGYNKEGWHGSGSGNFSTFKLSEAGGVFIAQEKSEAAQFAIGKDASLRRFFVKGDFGKQIFRSVDELRASKQAQRSGKDGILVSDSSGWDSFRNKPIERAVNYLVFDRNNIKSADPVTRDESGAVIPLSQRFNPESPSILYAAPIDTSTLPTRDPASGENVPDREAGSSENAETVSQRLESRRKEAISAAVAENDWGNYTREQKVAAAESFLAKWVVSFSAMEFPADVRFSVEVGDGSGAHVSVHEVPSRPLGIRVSVGQNRGLDKYANLSPTEVFAHLYDTAQEESIHVAQYLGMHRDWLETREQGFKGTFLSYIGQKLKDTFDQINKARIDLQQTDSAAAEKIKDAMLASWNIYHFNDRVEGIAGLWSRLEGDPSRQGDFIMEMVRQLTQLKRQDFTTETGWQKFQRVLKQWITDAINSLRGVQDVFRSGMAGDLIQRQLADLEAALEGKPLPPVSRGTPKSKADEGEPPTIDIGGEAEPADGKGKQLYQKNPTAIGDTYLTPADITLQEKKTQQETLDAARKIIGEEIAKTPGNTLAGRRAALDRFSLDTSIPPEVRAVGTGVIAQQADRMANLSEGDSQLLLDRMAEEAASLSDAMSSDLEGWRNLKADANLRIDKMAEEAGRTLNIFNVFRRLTPEGFLRRRMRQYNDAVREKMGQNFDVPVGDVEAEIKKAVAKKPTDPDKAIKALIKSLKPKPRAPREKIEKALKALFTADTVGALDDQAFFDAFGEAFNMPPLSDEQQTRIKKLIREVNALPKGPARLDKQQDLDEELALWKGIAARDVLLSAWYANILSGVSTQGMGLLGNALNFVPRSLFNMINNPRSAGAYFKGAFGEGLSTGLKEAAAAMKGRGLYKVSKYGDKNLVSSLELLRKKGPSTLPEWVAYIASAGTRLRYVFRIMQAIDALAWNTAREGHAYLAAHRALLEQEKASDTKRTPEEFSRAFIDSLGGDTAQIEEDLRAARQALIDAGQPPSMLTVDRMAREARNLRRAAGGVKAGNRFADRIVLQQDPEGSGKFISNLIDVFQKKDILGLPIGQLLIPFNRIVSNLFEQSLDYTPVGLVRAFLGGHLSDVKPGSFWNGKVEFKDKSQLFDQMERRERAMAAVTGMAAAAVIYALASAHEDEPDEDVPFMVYGWGPESKNKRAQMPKGWVPYSIKIGDNYVKFSEMPFGMMFAAAGSAMDAMRYKNMDKKTSTQRLAYVLKTAAKGFLNQGVMSSLDTAMETLMFDASEKKMADIPVNALKGLVPAQGMLRDISTIMDPNKVSSESLTSALLRDIPFAKSWGTKPDLNVFGEPIKLDGYPITRRIVTHREPHAVADYLGRNELNIPGMEQTIEIGKYLPDKAKDRIQARAVELGAMENGLFTPEQNYTFKKRAGELTKVAVQEIMEKNPKIATDKQRENIQSTINKRVEAARRRAMLEAVPVK